MATGNNHLVIFSVKLIYVIEMADYLQIIIFISRLSIEVVLMLQRVISLIVDGVPRAVRARINGRKCACRRVTPHGETMAAAVAGPLSPLHTSDLHSFGNNYLSPCCGKRGHEI